jgi:hypothetical protein
MCISRKDAKKVKQQKFVATLPPYAALHEKNRLSNLYSNYCISRKEQVKAEIQRKFEGQR